ncbi:uncharacterized protein LOC134528536 [Bacillus rossius redtenbacheri]|uniref:uncharacterized protein LOC134528536 n=1 Tax=Bacillus rossius redtenbacheri TaxID=93214 RepID=UPI002FDD00DA
MGPYPRSPRGKRFLLVVTDMFTRWTEAYPCSNARANTIIHLMTHEFLPRWGYPQSVLTDNGSQFLGKQWQEWCNGMSIQHHTTPAYHPRANPTERRNQDLKVQLRLRLGDDHTQWDQHVADALFCTRRRVNAATGRTPAEMVQGNNLPLPGEWATHGVPHTGEGERERARRLTAMHEAARQRQTNYTQEITPKTAREPPAVRAGDRVYARVHPLSAAPRNYCAGLAPRWRGPYTVQKSLGRTSYLVRLGGRRVRKIHRDDLRLASIPGEPPPGDQNFDEPPGYDEPEEGHRPPPAGDGRDNAPPILEANAQNAEDLLSPAPEVPHEATTPHQPGRPTEYEHATITEMTTGDLTPQPDDVTAIAVEPEELDADQLVSPTRGAWGHTASLADATFRMFVDEPDEGNPAPRPGPEPRQLFDPNDTETSEAPGIPERRRQPYASGSQAGDVRDQQLRPDQPNMPADSRTHSTHGSEPAPPTPQTGRPQRDRRQPGYLAEYDLGRPTKRNTTTHHSEPPTQDDPSARDRVYQLWPPRPPPARTCCHP